MTQGSAGVDKGSAQLVTSHHSLGYEPGVYGLQARVPTFTSLLRGGQKSPRKKSHSKTHGKGAIVYTSWKQRSPCSELTVCHVRRCDPMSAPLPRHVPLTYLAKRSLATKSPSTVTCTHANHSHTLGKSACGHGGHPRLLLPIRALGVGKASIYQRTRFYKIISTFF